MEFEPIIPKREAAAKQHDTSFVSGFDWYHNDAERYRRKVLSEEESKNAPPPPEKIEELDADLSCDPAFAPTVRYVTEDGVVARIQITTQAGEHIELECLYE